MLFYQKTTSIKRWLDEACTEDIRLSSVEALAEVRNVVWEVKNIIQGQTEYISIPNLTAEGTNADMTVKPFDAGKAVLV